MNKRAKENRIRLAEARAARRKERRAASKQLLADARANDAVRAVQQENKIPLSELPPITGRAGNRFVTAAIANKIKGLVWAGSHKLSTVPLLAEHGIRAWSGGGLALSADAFAEITQAAWLIYWQRIVRHDLETAAEQMRIARQSAVRAFRRFARSNAKMELAMQSVAGQATGAWRNRAPVVEQVASEDEPIAKIDTRELLDLLLPLADDQQQKRVVEAMIRHPDASAKQVALLCGIGYRTVRRMVELFRQRAIRELGLPDGEDSRGRVKFTILDLTIAIRGE